jgi:hypothetical protein
METHLSALPLIFSRLSQKTCALDRIVAVLATDFRPNLLQIHAQTRASPFFRIFFFFTFNTLRLPFQKINPALKMARNQPNSCPISLAISAHTATAQGLGNSPERVGHGWQPE